jgi:hypothetical protein
VNQHITQQHFKQDINTTSSVFPFKNITNNNKLHSKETASKYVPMSSKTTLLFQEQKHTFLLALCFISNIIKQNNILTKNMFFCTSLPTQQTSPTTQHTFSLFMLSCANFHLPLPINASHLSRILQLPQLAL